MTKRNKKVQKLIITFGLSGLLAAGMIACSSEDTSQNVLNSEEKDNLKEKDKTKEGSSEETVDMAEGTAEDKEDTAEKNKKLDFSYEDLEDVEFWFGSGAGAWCTTLKVEADGSFSGEYHDSDMGESGEGYPNGTCYISQFSGQFGELEKVNDYTYSTRITSIELKNTPETEEISDGIKYIYSEPYGVENAEEILFYLKGAPIAKLPEDYLSWIKYSYDMENQTELPFYGLYNVAEKEGFSGHVYSEDEVEEDTVSMEEELADLEQQAKELEDKIENQDLTQQEYNEISLELYELWDNELNKIWGQLKETLDEKTMAQLTEEEQEWISQKESEIKKAGAGYEGGSMQSMVENQKGAELTRARVYELVEKLEK